MYSELEKEIIKIIIYFDMFDYPLSAFEIWQYLPKKYTFQEVLAAIPALQNIVCVNGLYALSGRAENIKIKQKRYNLAEKKFKKAILVSKFFRLLPWIKMIAITNLIGAHNAKKQGDIDFLIITAPDKLWLTRFFCVSFLKIFNLRPTKNQTQDKICLSFFSTTDNLNFESLLLNQSVDNRDRYFTYWLANIYPIYNQNQTYQKLIKSNSWFQNYLPNWKPKIISRHRSILKINNNLYIFLISFLFNHFNNFVKQFQIKFMNQELKDKMNTNTEIVINDRIFKAHTTDRRQQYYEQYLKKLNIYLHI